MEDILSKTAQLRRKLPRADMFKVDLLEAVQFKPAYSLNAAVENECA